MTKRSALATVPALAAMAAVRAATAAASTKDPHPRIYRLMEAARCKSDVFDRAAGYFADECGTENMVFRVLEDISDRARILEGYLCERLTRAPATTPEGILAQARALRDLIDDQGSNWQNEVDLKLAKSITAGLERLAERDAGVADIVPPPGLKWP